MGDFFDALSEFFKSDLAKEYGCLIAVCFIICVCIALFLINKVYMNIILPSKTLELNNLQQKYNEILEELEIIKKENKDLKDKIQKYSYQEKISKVLNEENSSERKYSALDKFIKK